MERRNLAICYDSLGDLNRAWGRSSEAKEYYLQSLELRRQLYEETKTAQALNDLAASKRTVVCPSAGCRSGYIGAAFL